MRVSLVFYILATLAVVELKQFERCDLAFELIRQGMDNVGSLRDWVCLIEGESARSTAAVNTNANGSKDWGLYQINDKYWCSPGTPGKDCGIRCEDLLLDDISIASKCARLIFRRHQFTAWVAWRKHCQDPAALPDLQKECNILST